MSVRYSAERAEVRCDQCPGRPVLPTHREETDPRRCVRCQGEHRWLPQPHPEDHLCRVCRRECPGCQALTPDGGPCRACRGLCRTCSAPLPHRGPEADEVVRIAPERRKDHRHRWARTYFPRTWDRDRCDACQEGPAASDPVRAVLSALPAKVVRACGGAVPPAVVETARSELRHRTARQLVARIERRWWGGWAARPLSRPESADREGYRPDDVALWLLAPTPCAGGCEDGWRLTGRTGTEDVPCPVCRGGRRPAERPGADDDEEREPAAAADRTTAEAVAYRPPMRECPGKDGTCGVPVADPYPRCPACLDWPWCDCRRRRYDPDRATSCPACAAR
ncbi:hypothetical protein ADL22_06135 [Streptomyces sp. NRRL F-4489]|uniref:hypothetical protein n=1 Tax=Streptomyces sp. NRRL F-4489 TaxID=1609095 RepID=UPI00074AB99D|nr:hypothetical protein [Streptomyces sp. NRRL F-4489]KUL51376.1 hypothetical protein ADL22_06135 [Streptomyces sp. NRRL F-4489]